MEFYPKRFDDQNVKKMFDCLKKMFNKSDSDVLSPEPTPTQTLGLRFRSLFSSVSQPVGFPSSSGEYKLSDSQLMIPPPDPFTGFVLWFSESVGEGPQNHFRGNLTCRQRSDEPSEHPFEAPGDGDGPAGL